MDIVIEGNRIVDIVLMDPVNVRGHGPDFQRPTGDRVIDATGMYVIPGLIEMHGHFRPDGSTLDPRGLDYQYGIYLGHGVRTVRDAGTGVGMEVMAEQRRRNAQPPGSAPSGGPGGGPAAAAVPAGIGGSFSPDGRYLYYTARLPGPDVSATPGRAAGHGDGRGRPAHAGGVGRGPAVSPDGRFLVYGTRHETETGLRVRDLETGADRWLVWPVQRDEQEGRPTRDYLPGYAFTPDAASS